MPSLSTTVGKVLEICSRTDASPNELNKVISLDPVLTGQVLKLINSAYYSLMSKVTSLTRAITMLGMNTVKNMALSTAIINSVASANKSKALPTAKFWTHSIGVGVSSKLLAVASGVSLQEREEFFIAGMLHDLGKIPFGDEYIHVLSIARQEQRSLIEVERELLGIDHQEVGKLIAAKWKLTGFMASCICCHHDIGTAVGPPSEVPLGEEDRARVAIVTLANMYINIHDIGYAGDPFPEYRNAEMLLELTGLDWSDLAAISGVVEDEIQKAQIFLQV
ncbi:MAG: HDOD domain-containing protein [Proteobacteria bacterium]|nr:HDOD domain-containing protein [Pseudomonadota bacterium]MBU1649533.1 HDOD domain-containing protein [Pseudomonadota bacterium]MBU1986805.1 HDOD domain-containing protein [Pseudomonadota bacterium]